MPKVPPVARDSATAGGAAGDETMSKAGYLRAIGLWATFAVSLAGSGCLCLPLHPLHPLPVAGTPRELAMTSLPPYTINPPDVLLIDAVRLVPLPPYRLQPLDSLAVQFPAKPLPDKDV